MLFCGVNVIQIVKKLRYDSIYFLKIIIIIYNYTGCPEFNATKFKGLNLEEKYIYKQGVYKNALNLKYDNRSWDFFFYFYVFLYGQKSSWI